MRVSTPMITGHLAERIAANAERLFRLQQQVSSGKRMLAPSDDPTAAARAVEMRSSLTQIAQYADNVERATQKLKTVDVLLGDLGNAIRSARDIALQAANGAMSADSQAALARDLDDLIRRIMETGNAESNGYHVFAGYKTLTVPFATNPSGTPPVIYSGDEGQQSVEVGRDASIVVNVPGSVVFNMGGTANPALDDLFTTLTELRDQILAGDAAAISQQITDIDAHLQRVLVFRADVGGKVSQLDLCATRLQGMHLTVTDALSKTEDVDLSQVVVDLQTQENIYQATAAVAAQVSRLSLVDYLL